MPIFKKQDMWIPNKQYYSTNRQKSVVLHQDKLYVILHILALILWMNLNLPV